MNLLTDSLEIIVKKPSIMVFNKIDNYSPDSYDKDDLIYENIKKLHYQGMGIRMLKQTMKQFLFLH